MSDYKKRSILIALLATCLSIACSTDQDEGRGLYGNGTDYQGTDDTGFDTNDQNTDTAPNVEKGCTAMDILFIIDDSGSMGCEQSMLTQAFPQFIQVIENYNNQNAQAITYRIGVTSTGRSVKGTYVIKLPGFPEQRLPFDEQGMDGDLNEANGIKWVEGPGNTGEITANFTALASLGTDGPSYEMPLESFRMALDKMDGGPNDGFIRPDSLFIAVIITDEDDCSRTDNNFEIPDDSCMSQPALHNLVDLEEYHSMLDDRFGSEGYVTVVVAGQNSCDGSSYPTSCSEDDSYAGAKDARRLKDYVNNYLAASNDNNIFSDICTNTMQNALAQALDKMKVACDEFPPPV